MASRPEIKEFGKLLMQHVRDEAIRCCDRLMTPKSLSPIAERWRLTAKSSSPEALLREAIPDIVDTTMFYLLDAIDEGWLRLSYTTENGQTVVLNDGDVGALAGWLRGGSDTWLAQYAQERFADDFS